MKGFNAARATKMIPDLKHLSYPERLKKTTKVTNHGRRIDRRARGDMIEVFKIVAQIYDNKTTDNVLSFRRNMNISLRGHEFTLEHKRLSCPARIHFFANRMVNNNWNSLPNHVVHAGSQWRSEGGQGGICPGGGAKILPKNFKKCI